MSQRLPHPAIMDSVLCGKFHPKTGEAIIPLGFRADGRPVWPIMGASPDDDSNDADEDNDEGEDDPIDGEDDTDDGSEDKDNEPEVKNPRFKKLSDDNARKRNQIKDLRRQVEESNLKLKGFTDKDKDELTKSSESVTELTTRAEKAESKAAELALQNAFLSDNSFKWRNPKSALRLADLSKIEIDEDGDVVGLDVALKALARSDPYLLADDDEDEDDKSAVGQPPKTKKAKGTPEREKLVAKYPALRR